MSLTRSNLVSKVRMLCGEPPDEPLPSGLPSNLIFEELTTLESEMLRALDLSNQNRRVTSTSVRLIANSEDPFTLGVTDFNAPAYVYFRPDPSSDWYPVDIVNQGSLAQYSADNKLAVAFTGTPQQGYVSWIPESGHELQIWYDRSKDDNPTMGGSTELGSFYDDHLKLMCEAVCREHLGLQLGTMLVERLREGKEQFKRYVNMSRQQGMGSKSKVFTPPRYRRRYVGSGTRFVR